MAQAAPETSSQPSGPQAPGPQAPGPQAPGPQADGPLIEALRRLLGERLSTAQAVREHPGKDASYHATEMPDAVAFATSTEEVAAIVKLCAEHKRPVSASATVTAREGQVPAAQGGCGINVHGMNRIPQVDEDD